MGSLDDSRIADGQHEPGRDALPRVQADQQVGLTRLLGKGADVFKGVRWQVADDEGMLQ